MEVGGGAGVECAQGVAGAVPYVGAQELCGVVGCGEAEGSDLGVVRAQGRCGVGGEGAAVEEEGELVVPGSVRGDPVDAQQASGGDGQAEFLGQFAGGGRVGGSLASAMPPGRSQSGL